MPRERSSMRQIREVLRLKFEKKLSSRDIAQGCQLGRTTIREYLRRAKEAGLTWPLPVELDDAALEARLFPQLPVMPENQSRSLPHGQFKKTPQRTRRVQVRLRSRAFYQFHHKAQPLLILQVLFFMKYNGSACGIKEPGPFVILTKNILFLSTTLFSMNEKQRLLKPMSQATLFY
jgi:hypothetical protein